MPLFKHEIGQLKNVKMDLSPFLQQILQFRKYVFAQANDFSQE